MTDQTGAINRNVILTKKQNLNINKKVLVLAERIRKMSAPGNFYKQSVQHISYFNKEKVFFINFFKKNRQTNKK